MIYSFEFTAILFGFFPSENRNKDFFLGRKVMFTLIKSEFISAFFAKNSKWLSLRYVLLFL